MAGRLLTLTAVLLTILCGFEGWRSVRAGVGDSRQEDILRVENRWLQAEEDPSTLESILADDFIHVLPAGFVTKREQLDYLRSHPVAKRGARHFEDLRVRIFGTAGVVNGIVVATSAEGKTRRTLFTDVFVYRDGKWQAVNAQELSQSVSHR